MRVKAAFGAGALVLACLIAVVSGAAGFGRARGPATHVSAIHGEYARVHVGGATAAARGVRVKYLYGFKTVRAGQEFDAPLRCPKGFPHPISGGMDSDSNLTFLVTNRPDPAGIAARAAHSWDVGVTNTDPVKSANVTAIVVCAQ